MYTRSVYTYISVHYIQTPIKTDTAEFNEWFRINLGPSIVMLPKRLFHLAYTLNHARIAYNRVYHWIATNNYAKLNRARPINGLLFAQ